MPKLIDIFQPLDVPQDNNGPFYIVALGLLLPALNEPNSDAFDTVLEAIFDEITVKESRLLKHELKEYTPTTFPASLNKLINIKLRPHLAAYVRNHRALFMTHVPSDAALDQKISDIETPNHPCDDFEITALSALVKKSIQIHTDMKVSFNPSAESTLHILKSNLHYQLLIEPEKLNPRLRRTQAQEAKAPTSPVIPGNSADFFRKIRFEQQLNNVLQEIPQQLAAISQGISKQSISFDDPLSLIAKSAGISLVPRYQESSDVLPELTMSLPKANPQSTSAFSQRQARNHSSLSSGTSRLSEMSRSDYFALMCESTWGGLYNPTEIAFAGGSLAIASLLITFGIPATGSIYAEEYKEALKAAKRLFEEKNYDRAAIVLETELNRWAFARTTRALYLTKEHYTLLHYLRAIIAEKQKKFDIAYTQSELACRDAIASGNKKAIFITQFNKMKLLREHTISMPTEKVTQKTEFDRTLRALTLNNQQGFADLFWRIHQRFHDATLAFLSKQVLPAAAIQSANLLFDIKSLYLLKHFSDGRGEFLEMFSLFFQGVMLAFFHHANPAYLLQENQSTLVRTLCEDRLPTNDLVLTLAFKKFMQCAKQLEAFKESRSTHIRYNTAMTSCLLFIENFIIDFQAHFVDGHKASAEYTTDYYKTAMSLSIKKADAQLRLQDAALSTEVLVTLQRDFELTFNSLDEWFDALSGAEIGLMSVRTGKINTTSLAKDIPTLIKQNQKYFLYRKSVDDTWALIELDATGVTSAHLAFPAIAKVRMILPYQPQYPTLYALLAQHTQKSFAPRPELQTLVSKTTGDTLLHVLARLPLTGCDLTRRIQIVASLLNQQRYHRNHQHATPYVVLQASDPHQLKAVMDKPSTTTRTNLSERPHAAQRLQLLTHVLRMKQMELNHIIELSHATHGYTAQQLIDFVTSLKETTITHETMTKAFDKYARQVSETHQTTLKCKTVLMPSFEQEATLTGLFNGNLAIEEQLQRLTIELDNDPKAHTLLFGPPGCGNKTAAKMLAQCSGRAFITLNQQELTFENLSFIFQQAKKMGRVIICMQEVECFSNLTPEELALIKTEMDNTTKNNVVVIGTTHHIDKISPEVLNLFNWRILLKALSNVERNVPIVQALLTHCKKYSDNVSFDTDLLEEMQAGAQLLGKASEGLPISRIHDAFAYLMGDLKRAKPDYTGLTYLRLQDVLFYIDRMQAQDPKKPNATPLSCTQYINSHSATLFPATKPLHRCVLVLMPTVPTINALDTLPIHAISAYIRVQNQFINKLYYIHTVNRECIELDIPLASLTKFDETLEPSLQPKILLRKDLAFVTQITGHSLIKTSFSIDVLSTLKDDFDLTFPSISAWLNALLSPENTLDNLISEKTGDTMLHLLTQFNTGDDSVVTQVKAAISKLKNLRYTRNARHETPFFALQKDDPYLLSKSLCSHHMINLNHVLDHVDEFIETAKRSSKVKRVLLLEGPPGTGKSEIVLSHLKAQDYVIHEWVSGHEGDKLVNGLLTRIRVFFEEIIKAADHDPLKIHILFVDELDSVCPLLTGIPEAGHFNHKDAVNEFIKQTDKLKSKCNVILIGTTNYPDNIEPAMMSRAIRQVFALPDELGREKLLQHFFAEKCISNALIQRIAKLTTGWSPRSLQSFTTSIKVDVIDEPVLEHALSESAKILSADFRRQFPHAHITLPTLKEKVCTDPLFGLAITQAEMREKFIQLANTLNHPEHYGDTRIHVLLHGPKGGGKTTAVRTFAHNANFTFILIEPGITPTEIHRLFDRAKAFNPAIIFIDEIDQIAYDGGPFREFLQTEMDGFTQNNISVIGATNYPERIAEPLLDRFAIKIHVPPLGPEERGALLTSMIKEQLECHPDFETDSSLKAELEAGCLHLSDAAKESSIRAIKSQMVLFFGDLRGQKNKKPDEIICITLTALLQKIRSHPLPSSSPNTGFFPPNGGLPSGLPGSFMPHFH